MTHVHPAAQEAATPARQRQRPRSIWLMLAIVLCALVAGAGAAVVIYVLVDDDPAPPPSVVVPVPIDATAAKAIDRSKNEARTALGITGGSTESLKRGVERPYAQCDKNECEGRELSEWVSQDRPH